MESERGRRPQAEELYQLGLEAFRRGDQAESKRLNEEALAMARLHGDRVNETRALIGLSRVAFRAGNHAEIERLAAVCLPLWEALTDKTVVVSPRHMLAESHRLHRRFDQARELYLRNIGEAEARGDRYVVELETINLALLEVTAGDPERAKELVRSCVGDDERTDDPYVLLARGAARVHSGEVAGGAADLAASAELLAQAEEILDPADQGVFDEAASRARAELGEDAWAALLSTGRRGSSGRLNSA